MILTDVLRHVGWRRELGDTGARVVPIVHEVAQSGGRVAVDVDHDVGADVARLAPGHPLAPGETGSDLVLADHVDAVAPPGPVVGEEIGDAGGVAEVDEMAVGGDQPFAGPLIGHAAHDVVNWFIRHATDRSGRCASPAGRPVATVALVTRLAVVGPGGVGTFFAAHLASADHDVVACARRPFTEYVVESDTAPTSGPAVVMTDPDDVDGPVDWVLLAVKAHQTEGAAGWLAALCDTDTNVVTVQNGVEGRTRAEPFVNGATVWPAVVYCGADLIAPGHTRHTSHGMLIVPDKPAMHELADLFAGTGANVKPDPDYLTALWRKLGINTVVNGLSALTDKPIGVVGEPTLRPVAEQLLAECWAVAAAEGATLGEADIGPALDAMVGVGGTTSMRTDRQHGRPTEHDALYGAVVRIGERHGIATPTQAVVGALIAAGDPISTGSNGANGQASGHP